MPRVLTVGLVVNVFVWMATSSASVGLAQGLDGRFALPDSAGLMKMAEFAAYDSVTSKLYIGACCALGVIQGPQSHRSRRIDMPVGGYGNFSRPFVHQRLGKVYVVPGRDTIIAVVRTADDSILGYLRAPANTTFMGGTESACLAEDRDRLYAMTTRGCAVYDLDGDSLLRVVEIPFSYGVGQMCYNYVSDRFYVGGGENEVAIYHAGPDTLVCVVQAGNGATRLGYLARRNKVYFTNYFGASVTVIDGAGDSVIAEVATPTGPEVLVMNETSGNVYVSCDPGYCVLDGKNDSLRRVINMAHNGRAGVWHAPTNTAFLSAREEVIAVDGLSDSVLTAYCVPQLVATGAASNPSSGTVYFTSSTSSDLLCIEAASDSVLWREYAGVGPVHSVVWSRQLRRLFAGGLCQSAVASVGMHPSTQQVLTPLTPYPVGGVPTCVVDGETDRTYAFIAGIMPCVWRLDGDGRIVDSVPLPGTPDAAVLAPGGHRLYLGVNGPANDYLLCVVDSDHDSLVRSFLLEHPGDDPGAVSVPSGKVYWPEGNGVVVVSLEGDSVMGRLSLAEENSHVCGAFAHPTNGLVYVATTGGPRGIHVIDSRTDSVVAFIGSSDECRQFCYAPTWDKLYALGSGGSILVIDCTRNVVLRYISSVPATTMVYNPVGDKVHVSNRSYGGMTLGCFRVVAIDCATDRPVARIEVGPEPRLAVDPDSGFVFAACENSAVYVIRDRNTAGVADAPSGRVAGRVSLSATPNPAMGGTLVELTLPVMSHVALGVYDASGRLVRMLMSGEAGPGRVQVVWDGSDGAEPLPSGVYYVALVGTSLSRKVVIQR